MDVLWIAPTVALGAALGGLLVAGHLTRRAAADLAADVPGLTALGDEGQSLQRQVGALQVRLEARRAASSAPDRRPVASPVVFNLGAPEVLVIMMLALIVLGPQRLPEAAKQVGRFMSEIRKMSSGFQHEMKAAFEEETETAARAKGAAAVAAPDPAAEPAVVDEPVAAPDPATEPAVVEPAVVDEAAPAPTAKKAAPRKRTTPLTKASIPAKKAAPAKKATPAKKAAPPKKAT